MTKNLCAAYRDQLAKEELENKSLRQQLDSRDAEIAELTKQLSDNNLFDSDRNQWRNNYRSIIADLTKKRDQLREELSAAQARIDELMLEYCPDEMTKDQIDNWAKHQQAVPEN